MIGLCELMVKPFAHTNPSVRQAAIQMSGQMYVQFGKIVKQFLDMNVKPASLTLVEQEFAKVDSFLVEHL